MAGSGKTADILRKIQAAKSITKMLRATAKAPVLPPVGEFLDGLRKERGLKKEEFFSIGGVSTVYGYEILRGVKSPSRDTLLRFAFAFDMDIAQTNRLLQIGEKAQLYPLLKRDALIIYALTHDLDIAEVNLAAEENGILPIGNY